MSYRVESTWGSANAPNMLVIVFIVNGEGQAGQKGWESPRLGSPGCGPRAAGWGPPSAQLLLRTLSLPVMQS